MASLQNSTPFRANGQRASGENGDSRQLGRRAMLMSGSALLAASTVGLSSAFGQQTASPQTTSPVAGKAMSAGPASSSSAQKAGIPPWDAKMVGFMLAHEQFTGPQLLDIGAAAEKADFDLLATSDHFQPWQANQLHSGQAWVTMGALGQRTHRVWMGTTVTCPTLRYHPAVVAEAFASLSRLSPGRIFLGVGSGEALNEQAATGEWPAWQERWDRLIESMDIIRQLWSGQPVAHQGKHYKVNATLFDSPAQPIPLLAAANGPKAMRLAGQHGDGLVTDPKTWREHKSEFLAGAQAAGKNAAQMPVLVEHYAVVGSQKEAEVAAELWRFGPKAFKGYHNIQSPAEIQRRADAEIPLPKVYGDWAIGTDPEVHVKAILDLFKSGATIVNVHAGQPDQKRVIEFYGREVLPKVRQAIAKT